MNVFVLLSPIVVSSETMNASHTINSSRRNFLFLQFIVFLSCMYLFLSTLLSTFSTFSVLPAQIYTEEMQIRLTPSQISCFLSSPGSGEKAKKKKKKSVQRNMILLFPETKSFDPGVFFLPLFRR